MGLCSILALILVTGVSAEPSDAGTFVKTLSETGKLPGDTDWVERLAEALTVETAESHALHPITLSIITDSIPGFSGNGDPTRNTGCT